MAAFFKMAAITGSAKETVQKHCNSFQYCSYILIETLLICTNIVKHEIKNHFSVIKMADIFKMAAFMQVNHHLLYYSIEYYFLNNQNITHT